MAYKAKNKRRSLVSLKRTEPSKKEKLFDSYIEGLVNGEIAIDELVPPEEVPAEELAKFPSIDSIVQQMTSNLNGDIEHDLELLETIIGKYENYPQPLHLQMTLLRKLADHITPEQKDELMEYISGQNSVDLDIDEDLNNKIIESLTLLDMRRRSKAVKHLEACIRRIEAKHTPHEHKGLKVYSFSSITQEFLAFPKSSDDESPKYYHAPAGYALAYQLYAGLMEESGKYSEAMEALVKSLSWNPYDADTRLQMSNIFISLDETMQAAELLKETYPYIVTESQLANFYMQHSMILLSMEDDEKEEEEFSPFAFRLQRLSQFLIKPEISDDICNLIDQLSDTMANPVSREEFIAELDAHEIPFGTCPSALEALKSTIENYGDDEPKLRATAEATYQKLSTCFDDFKEI